MGQMTIVAGVKELKAAPEPGAEEMTQRQRRSVDGRKSVTSKSPEIIGAIEEIIDTSTRGDPMAPLKWTAKSLAKIR